MKRFIVSILCVSVFFIGLGALADGVGAQFKSDEKALDIIKKARTAIGGDAALAEVRSMVIKGQTSHTFKIDGVERTETGETEIAMQLPDKLMKMVKIGKHDVAVGDQIVERRVDVVVTGKNGDKTMILEGGDGEFASSDGKKIIVRKAEGGEIGEIKTGDGKKVIVRKMEDGVNAGGERKEVRIKRHGGGEHSEMRQNELLRTTLALLLTAPDGMEVSYTFAGESTVEGTAVNVVVASFAGSSFKLFFDRSSNLPVAMSFVGHPMPLIFKFKKEGSPQGGEPGDAVVFNKKLEGKGENVEHFVRFSDYRGTNGVQLPYKWTTTIGGQTSDVFDVTSYEINPANIADRFKDQKVFVRTAKPVEN